MAGHDASELRAMVLTLLCSAGLGECGNIGGGKAPLAKGFFSVFACISAAHWGHAFGPRKFRCGSGLWETVDFDEGVSRHIMVMLNGFARSQDRCVADFLLFHKFGPFLSRFGFEDRRETFGHFRPVFAVRLFR